MNMHGSGELSDLDIVQNITEIKGTLKDHQHEIDRLNSDVLEMKSETKTIHDLSENIAGMVVGLQYMKEGVEAIKSDQNEIKDEVSTINDKINDLENKPANETRNRMLDIRDKIIIAVGSAALGAIISAILGIAF